MLLELAPVQEKEEFFNPEVLINYGLLEKAANNNWELSEHDLMLENVNPNLQLLLSWLKALNPGSDFLEKYKKALQNYSRRSTDKEPNIWKLGAGNVVEKFLFQIFDELRRGTHELDANVLQAIFNEPNLDLILHSNDIDSIRVYLKCVLAINPEQSDLILEKLMTANALVSLQAYTSSYAFLFEVVEKNSNGALWADYSNRIIDRDEDFYLVSYGKHINSNAIKAILKLETDIDKVAGLFSSLIEKEILPNKLSVTDMIFTIFSYSEPAQKAGLRDFFVSKTDLIVQESEKVFTGDLNERSTKMAGHDFFKVAILLQPNTKLRTAAIDLLQSERMHKAIVLSGFEFVDYISALKPSPVEYEAIYRKLVTSKDADGKDKKLGYSDFTEAGFPINSDPEWALKFFHEFILSNIDPDESKLRHFWSSINTIVDRLPEAFDISPLIEELLRNNSYSKFLFAEENKKVSPTGLVEAMLKKPRLVKNESLMTDFLIKIHRNGSNLNPDIKKMLLSKLRTFEEARYPFSSESLMRLVKEFSPISEISGLYLNKLIELKFPDTIPASYVAEMLGGLGNTSADFMRNLIYYSDKIGLTAEDPKEFLDLQKALFDILPVGLSEDVNNYLLPNCLKLLRLTLAYASWVEIPDQLVAVINNETHIAKDEIVALLADVFPSSRITKQIFEELPGLRSGALGRIIPKWFNTHAGKEKQLVLALQDYAGLMTPKEQEQLLVAMMEAGRATYKYWQNILGNISASIQLDLLRSIIDIKLLSNLSKAHSALRSMLKNRIKYEHGIENLIEQLLTPEIKEKERQQLLEILSNIELTSDLAAQVVSNSLDLMSQSRGKDIQKLFDFVDDYCQGLQGELDFQGQKISNWQVKNALEALRGVRFDTDIEPMLGYLLKELILSDNPSSKLEAVLAALHDKATHAIVRRFNIFRILYTPQRIAELLIGKKERLALGLIPYAFNNIADEVPNIQEDFFRVLMKDLIKLQLAAHPEEAEAVLASISDTEIIAEIRGGYIDEQQKRIDIENANLEFQNTDVLPQDKYCIKAVPIYTLVEHVDGILLSREFTPIVDSDRTPFDADTFALVKTSSKDQLAKNLSDLSRYGEAVLIIDRAAAANMTEEVDSKLLSTESIGEHKGYRTGITVEAVRGIMLNAEVNAEKLEYLKYFVAFKMRYPVAIIGPDGKELFSIEQAKELAQREKYTVKVSDKLGSNDGGAYLKVSQEGISKVYVKYAGDAESSQRLGNEFLMNNLYAAAGISAANTSVEDGAEYGIAGSVIVSEWFEGSTIDQTRARQLPSWNNGFIIDAWLANWDVPAAISRNTLLFNFGKGDTVVRVDNGGGGLFRARGGEKVGYGPVVIEVDSLRGSYEVSNDEIVEQISFLQEKFTDALIDQLVDSAPLLNEENKRKLKHILKVRRDFLAQYANTLIKSGEGQKDKSENASASIHREINQYIHSNSSKTDIENYLSSRFKYFREVLIGSNGYQHNKENLGQHIVEVIYNLVNQEEFMELSELDKALAIFAAIYHDWLKPVGAVDEEVERDRFHGWPSAAACVEYMLARGASIEDALGVSKVIVYDGLVTDIIRGQYIEIDKEYKTPDQLLDALGDRRFTRILKILNKADALAVVGQKFDLIADEYEQYFSSII